MENYGIKHYFKEIYGGDKYLKPSKESYLMACGDCNPNECIMIGDNYTNDYEGAIKAGLKAIYLNLKDIEVDKDVTSIKSLIELKNIL
jgi:FMN phosphatase YigB (HAD superfamily)